MIPPKAYIAAFSDSSELKPELISSLIPNAGIRRRMNRLTRSAIAVGLQALSNSGLSQVDAIITASGLGLLEESEKFLRTLIENNEQYLNPTPFIYSTFNTVGAQLAMLLKNHGYNMTYTHRNHSFESALIDALSLLQTPQTNSVLLGAFDILTPSSEQILRRLGSFRHDRIPFEGASFFVLTNKPSSKTWGEIYLPQILSLPKEPSTPKELLTLNPSMFPDSSLPLLITWNGQVLSSSEMDIQVKKKYPVSPTLSAYALWNTFHASHGSYPSQVCLIYTQYPGMPSTLIPIRFLQS